MTLVEDAVAVGEGERQPEILLGHQERHALGLERGDLDHKGRGLLSTRGGGGGAWLTRPSRRAINGLMTAVRRWRAPRTPVCWGIGILLIGMLQAHPAPAQILEIDALLALKRLATATRLDLTYQEYASQLAETKRTVDRFLHSPGGAPSAIPMALAMAYYELAGTTWRASIERSSAGYVVLGQRREQDHGACPDITRVIETATASLVRRDDRRVSARREEIGKEATRSWPRSHGPAPPPN